MKSPELSASEDGQRRVEFNNAPEQEQIERFAALNSLFADKKTEPRGNFQDFFENVYKYAGKFKMEGMTAKQVAETLESARDGNGLIKDALEYYLEVRKNQAGVGGQNDMEMARAALEGRSRRFVDEETKQLDVKKMTEMFKWSLATFISGGEKIGRAVPEGLQDEVEPLSEDLEIILQQVNQFR